MNQIVNGIESMVGANERRRSIVLQGADLQCFNCSNIGLADLHITKSMVMESVAKLLVAAPISDVDVAFSLALKRAVFSNMVGVGHRHFFIFLQISESYLQPSRDNASEIDETTAVGLLNDALRRQNVRHQISLKCLWGSAHWVNRAYRRRVPFRLNIAVKPLATEL